MTIPADVMSDMATFRPQWLAHVRPGHELLRTGLARPLIDIALDWSVVIAAVVLVVEAGMGFVPLALLLLGNRQRALGNILHDAGHRNLSRTARVNDAMANMLVAPLLLTSLTRYRALHFAHHLALGDARRDPDFMALPSAPGEPWWLRYARTLCSPRSWLGSIGGHLVDPSVPVRDKFGMLIWWVAVLCFLDLVAGSDLVLAFVVLWFGARATVFHLITTFREMCDHVGLRPGGIFSFTRDVSSRGFWRWLIHPRNNGYHLTHHLCPAIPYYRLPQAHRLFRQLSVYRERAVECDAYFSGERAVTRAWSTVCAS
jgi:fatty acid desaturase